MLEGKYLFYDNLEFDFQHKDNWKYCNKDDRRFYTEIMQGLRPEGKTLIVNDINGPRTIPDGTYGIFLNKMLEKDITILLRNQYLIIKGSF